MFDFDPFDPRRSNDPFSMWDSLREDYPVARSNLFSPPVNFLSRYDDVRAAAYDPEVFSSREVLVVQRRPSVSYGAPPLAMDPPHHRQARMILAPMFARPIIDAMAPSLLAIADGLIKQVGRRAEPDAAAHFTLPFTACAFALFLGVPLADGAHMARLSRAALNNAANSEIYVIAMRKIGEYIVQAISRPPQPGGILGRLIAYRSEGRSLSREFIIDIARLLVIAGSETTSGVLGGAIFHLATHQDVRDRLLADPLLLAPAIEEFLRLYSPVSTGREVLKDVDIGGTPVKMGERLIMSFAAANRDPTVFSDPHCLDFERVKNNHLAFGAGIHRCLGAYFARAQLRIGIERWLDAYPTYRLRGAVDWTNGMNRTPVLLPVEFS
jgi:cytochrome P450